MSLLEEIKRVDSEAAKVLEQADCRCNTDIQSLTREDLNELFPGAKKLILRKTISEIIHKQKPINLVLNELKGFLPSESLKAALTGNGALSEYLLILRDLKTQMEKVSEFIDTHITLLEENTGYHNEKETNNGVVPNKTTLPVSPPMPPKLSEEKRPGSVTDRGGKNGLGVTFGLNHTILPFLPQRHVGPTTGKWTVKVLSVISSETFGSHQTLLDRVNNLGGLQLMHTDISQECETVIVFCPVCSRLESDIEAALSKIPVSLVDKAVILVLLHHNHNVNYTFPRIPLPSRRHNILITVNVLYHDSVQGLLSCPANDQAVSEMHMALLERGRVFENVACWDVSDTDMGFGRFWKIWKQ